MGTVLWLIMYSTVAWGKTEQGKSFSKITIQRNLPGDDDVQFNVLFCGICHTDVHYAEATMPRPTVFPLVPGHELVGEVTEVGRNVNDVTPGDKVGVGYISDTCLQCGSCVAGEEQLCEKGMTNTCNGPITHGHIKTGFNHALGGYSEKMTINRKFIVKVPKNFKLEMAGPIMCAGITMYSPLKHWGCLNGGKKIGIVGIGGLGQMGIRMAKAMGNQVTAISTSPSKEKMTREIGADNFIISSDPASMATATKSLDVILNTVSAPHNLPSLIGLLARDGTIVQLGVVLAPHSINQLLFFRRVNLSGSMIGGMADTQECLDFCAEKEIQPSIEIITANRLEEVFEKLMGKNDQVTRYVLDI